MGLPAVTSGTLVGQYAADQITSPPASGSALATWNDLSGNGNDATQATGAEQPLYETNVLNGLPGVLFGSAAETFMAIAASLPVPWTVCAVILPQDVTQTFARFFATSTSGFAGITGSEWWLSEAGGSNLEGGAPADNTAYLYVGQANGASSLIRVNQAQVAAGNAGSGSTASTLNIGSPSATRFWPGYVCELVIYNGALSATDYEAVETYLFNKWFVAPVAPAATTGAATNVADKTAVLNGTVNPEGNDATVHFEYGTTTAYGTSTANQDAGSGSSGVPMAQAVSGLTPNTTYHYRVVAVNRGGTTHGADQTFTTLATPPAPPQRTFYDRPRLQLLIGGKDLTERADTIVFSATDTGGYEIATFGLPAADRPSKGTSVIIRQGLEVAWQGRVAEVADHSQHGRATRTTGCEGLVAGLHDNPMQMIYVDRDLTQWSDPSTSRQIQLIGLNDSLASSLAAPDTASGLPSIIQEIDDSWASPYTPLCESWYDAGAENLIAWIYYNLIAEGPALATTDQVFLSSDDAASSVSASGNIYSTVGASGYFGAAAARYAAIQKHYNSTPGGAQGARYLTAWRNLAVYGNHGLTRRGPDPGGFYPSDVVRHALSQVVGITPGTIIDATGYIAPHVVYRTPTDPATIIDDMAKLMGWTWGVWEPKTVLDSLPRLDFRPYPSDATAVVTKADCDQIDITSRLGDLYNIAEISYTDVTGKAGVSTVTLANPQMVEAGISERTLQLNMGLGSGPAATAFGLFALALSQVSARAAGQATLPVAVRLPNGGSKPAVLLRPGLDRLRIIDLIDGGPMLDIGTRRRDVFRISRVETTVAKDGTPSTRAELDSGTNLLERLQARLALADGVVGAGASGG